MTALWNHYIVWLYKRINEYKDSHIAEFAVFCVIVLHPVALWIRCRVVLLISTVLQVNSTRTQSSSNFQKAELPLKMEIHQNVSGHVFTDSIFLLTKES